MFSLRSNRWRYKVLEQKRLEINFSFLARYIHSYRTREIPRAPSLPRLFRYNVTMRLYLSMTRSRICARRKYIPSLFLSFLFSKPYYYVNTWLAQGLVSTRGRFNVVSTHLYNSVYTYSWIYQRDSSNYQKMQDRHRVRGELWSWIRIRVQRWRISHCRFPCLCYVSFFFLFFY